MKILDKFTKKQNDYYSERTPTIAFFGDSVTHGCFEIYTKNANLETVVDTKSGYHEKIREIFNTRYPDVPVNIINAGISGDTAFNAINRIERDVLSFSPDLVIVCFGLNDAMDKADGISKYESSLLTIFEKLQAKNTDIIFLTPNMCTDKVEIPFGDKTLDNPIASVIENEKNGMLAKYIECAKKVSASKNIPVCDCHKIWKTLTQNGVNVNNLLSNRVNHPTREMHSLFAYEIIRTIFTN